VTNDGGEITPFGQVGQNIVGFAGRVERRDSANVKELLDEFSFFARKVRGGPRQGLEMEDEDGPLRLRQVGGAQVDFQPIALDGGVGALFRPLLEERLLFVGRFSVKEGHGGNVAGAKGGDEPGDVDECRTATRFGTVKKAENINPDFLSLVNRPVN
jgi:hypothetical protein